MDDRPEPNQRIDFRNSDTTQRELGKLSLDERKESAAQEVARVITYTFAASAILLLIGGFFILVRHETGAKAMLVDAGIPFLEKGGLFLSSTFGPLLAFVLGYYFGEKGQTKRSTG